MLGLRRFRGLGCCRGFGSWYLVSIVGCCFCCGFAGRFGLSDGFDGNVEGWVEGWKGGGVGVEEWSGGRVRRAYKSVLGVKGWPALLRARNEYHRNGALKGITDG